MENNFDFKISTEMANIENGKNYDELCKISIEVAQSLKKYELSYAEAQFIFKKVDSVLKNSQLVIV